MNLHHFVVAALLVASATQATAQAYKCAGPGGKIEYRDMPCSSSQKVEKTFNQELGSATPAPSQQTDSASAPAAVFPAAPRATAEQAANGTNGNNGTNGTNSVLAGNPEPTIIDSRSDPVAGGVCSRSISWDSCRKLGIESIVDCKRMDDDAVFRASVLQSKGIQCRTRIGRFPNAR